MIKLLICNRKDGLGNRLINYIYAKSISLHYNIPCVLAWCINNNNCKCSLTDIFCNFRENEYVDTDRYKIVSPNQIIHHLNEYYKSDIDININKYIRFGGDYLDTKHCLDTDILLLSSHRLKINGFDELQYQRSIIDNLFKIENYNKFIQKNLSSYLEKYINYDLIGLHIRRGDSQILMRGRVPLDNFYEIIDTQYYDDKKYKFLISSDSDNVTQIICDKYNNIFKSDKCIYYKCRSQDTEKIESIQDAFITLILLSKCKIIYGSPSSFSNLAALIGNISKVTIELKQTSNTIKHIKELTNKTFDLSKSNYNSNTILNFNNEPLINIEDYKEKEILTKHINDTIDLKFKLKNEIEELTIKKNKIITEYKILKYNKKKINHSINEFTKKNEELIQMNKDNNNIIAQLKSEYNNLFKKYNESTKIIQNYKEIIQDINKIIDDEESN
jgi:hypothetical protein